MEILTSLDQLPPKLAEAEQKQALSDDAFRQAVSSWCLSTAVWGEVPPDPYSEAYKAFQLNIYEHLTGRPYQVSNEDTTFDFAHELQWPYPYGTQSARTVGTSLMGYGWLIKKMNLPAGSRILEIGSGYGSLTIHLAGMGYHVTCLDINPAFLDFIHARTGSLPRPPQTVCGDMATVELDETFDAVIFNASLHHSLEHRAVIRRLDDWVVPHGLVAFTAEPVLGNHAVQLPYPWGIRLDGLSLWSICKWGWLELGFQEAYFVQMLQDAGWQLKRSSLGLAGQTDVWLAARERVDDWYAADIFAAYGDGEAYGMDLEAEVLRLRQLVAGYENGRFIRLTKWLKDRTRQK
ncbi:MAG: class I SAM-dependent methyltransferase [Anaerolineales bacterium]|nr:class I SAM-dependent methyltransferase [Anaerolineales bacterium]